MTKITEIRQAFWDMHPEFSGVRRAKLRQNSYPTDIRVSFVDFVDRLAKDGYISEKLASRATL